MKKIENNGTAFLTTKGLRTPSHIWEGTDNFGTALRQPTRKELKASIERNNRVFEKFGTDLCVIE